MPPKILVLEYFCEKKNAHFTAVQPYITLDREWENTNLELRVKADAFYFETANPQR